MRQTIFGISIFLLFPVFLSAAVFPGQLPPTVSMWAALKDGGEISKSTGGSTREQFADWLNSNF